VLRIKRIKIELVIDDEPPPSSVRAVPTPAAAVVDTIGEPRGDWQACEATPSNVVPFRKAS
jgi:hypothetical protein